MRIYDPRLGKFLSVDPLTRGYPMLTPYQYASNRPIDGIDLDGLEFYKAEDAKVSMTFGFDPVQKKISSAWTFYIREHLPLGLEQSIDFTTLTKKYNANIVASFDDYINFGTLVSEAQTLEMADAEQPPNSLGESNWTTKVVPQNNKQLRAQNLAAKQIPGPDKSAAYYKSNLPAIETASVKINGWMAAVHFVGLVVESFGEDNIERNQQRARTQSITALNKVVGLIQNEIDKGEKGLIPKKYQDSYYLIDMANYMLNGREPSGYSSEQNQEIKNIGMQIFQNYIVPIRDRERIQKEKLLLRKTIDNVGSGTKKN